MILTRQGNKRSIADKIIPFFPKHDYYVEPFFGAGGMFFSKDKAKYNLLNDSDNEVANLYFVIQNYPTELYNAIDNLFVHQTVFNWWLKYEEETEVMKAVRFLMLSNFSLYGSMTTFRFYINSNTKTQILERIEQVREGLKSCQFTCLDFRKILPSGIRKVNTDKTFVYCDPPYQQTKAKSYRGFSEQDFVELIELLISCDVKFAISEFDSDVVLRNAEKYNLNIHYICERRNVLNRRTEVLLTNYQN